MSPNKQTEYGLLYYDIPANNMTLYSKIKRMVNLSCLPVNLSVYVFDWSLKPMIENELQRLNAFKLANINMIKFDNASASELETIIVIQMEKLFEKIKQRVVHSMSNIETSEKKEKYLERMYDKLKGFDKLLTIYEFTKKTEPALKILRQSIDTEYANIKGKV